MSKKPEVSFVGWNELPDGLTSVLIVPGGLVVERAFTNKGENDATSSMAFVPCAYAMAVEWTGVMLTAPKT